MEKIRWAMSYTRDKCQGNEHHNVIPFNMNPNPNFNFDSFLLERNEQRIIHEHRIKDGITVDEDSMH